jgi:hypothetical protein
MRREPEMNEPLTIHPSPRVRAVALLLVVVAIGLTAAGLLRAPDRVWPNLLLGGVYMMSLGISGLFIWAVWRLTGARWAAGLRRIPEAYAQLVAPAAVLVLALFLGRGALYSWARPGAFVHDVGFSGRGQYLHPSFVVARQIGIFALWILFAWVARRMSLAQDREPASSLVRHDRMNRLSALFVVLFVPTFSIFAYDWIVSLEPYWFSTMFAVYIFAGAFVQGIAAVTLVAAILCQRGIARPAIGAHQLHDLGKMLLSFSIFWGYIWLCQYLLIWYGNIPEEVTHYVKRTSGPWLIPFAVSFIVNWALPFTILLSVRTKQNPRVLKVICLLILAGRALDLYVLIMPALWPRPQLGIFELGIFAGYVGLIYLLFTRSLSKAPLIPVSDPVLAADHITATAVHA